MAATNFAKILGAFDLGVQNPILAQAQVSQMWKPVSGNWLKGWFCNPVPDGKGGTINIHEHNGILAGSSSYAGRRDDGISFVMFANDEKILGGADGLALSNLANAVTRWPTHDLFPSEGIPAFKRIGGLKQPIGTGCPGSAGTPSLAGTGQAETGNPVVFELSGAPAAASSFVLIGLTRASIDLGLIGAPGCTLFVSAIDSAAMTTDPRGGASLSVVIPVDPNLVGAHVFAQYAILEPRANNLGLTVSNGLDVTIGGYRSR